MTESLRLTVDEVTVKSVGLRGASLAQHRQNHGTPKQKLPDHSIASAVQTRTSRTRPQGELLQNHRIPDTPSIHHHHQNNPLTSDTSRTHQPFLQNLRVGDSRVCHVTVNAAPPIPAWPRPRTTSDRLVVTALLTAKRHVIHAALSGREKAARSSDFLRQCSRLSVGLLNAGSAWLFLRFSWLIWCVCVSSAVHTCEAAHAWKALKMTSTTRCDVKTFPPTTAAFRDGWRMEPGGMMTFTGVRQPWNKTPTYDCCSFYCLIDSTNIHNTNKTYTVIPSNFIKDTFVWWLIYSLYSIKLTMTIERPHKPDVCVEQVDQVVFHNPRKSDLTYISLQVVCCL